jgi:hypothetical protein
LRHLLATRTFLFIGFSLEDEHFGVELRGVSDLFQGYAGRHYALVRPQDAARVQSLGVVPVELADFGAQLVELVEELGRRAAAGPLSRAAAPEADAREADWSRYLDVLIDQTDHIEIRGISTSSSVHAPRHPIEQLYTPLTSRGMTSRALAPSDLGLEALDGGPVELTDLLPRHRRLLIEGQPGAGKTTFLRLVACILARDAAGRPCPGGGSWRELHLGLPSDVAPPTPIFLRLADLVPLLAADSALRHDDERWLLDLLENLAATNDYPIPRPAWQEVLGNGSAVLLLDGLDEVADPDLRGRLFTVFRHACKRWPCLIVVTSRPIQTEELREMDFHVATIEPFGEAEIRRFVDGWVTALHAEPDENRANFAWHEPNVGCPTPVGIYPAGNGRLGHCDLAGNVWEWCEEVWSEDHAEQRVLRAAAGTSPRSSCGSLTASGTRRGPAATALAFGWPPRPRALTLEYWQACHSGAFREASSIDRCAVRETSRKN